MEWNTSPIKNWKEILNTEQTLDPDDWQDAEQIGHQMISDMIDYLKTIDKKPIWSKPSHDLKESIKGKWSEDGKELSVLYAEFQKNILPFPSGNIHPRFWSWVQGTGTISGAYADFLASSMDSNVTIGDHAAMYIDGQVVNWFCTAMGYDPSKSSGILVSGGSIANITGLMIARNNAAPDIRTKGVQNQPKPMVFYASSETHSCQLKAAEAMGLGSESLKKIRVNAEYQMDVNDLIESIEKDIATNLFPFCVVANVGTVNTGAIDPLEKIISICKKYNLWLHIDGAFGALVKLLPEYDHLVHWISQADSIAFDLHKWMYLPYETGCLLVKNKNIHRNAFAQQPNYLISHERGLSAGPDPIGNYGMELSRGFKALKVWFSLQEHGRKKYEVLIRQNIAQCQYLADLILNNSSLQLMAPVPMNIVCFRFYKAGLDQSELNDLNKEILMQLHERAIATPSYTILDGNYVIRVANVNHRSKKSDFEALVNGVVDIGNSLAILVILIR